MTSLPFYRCRWWAKANDKVNYYFKIFIYMYMIVTLEVVYDHVGKCRKLALCYFIQINLILFCLTTIWKSEMKQKVTWLKPKNIIPGFQRLYDYWSQLSVDLLTGLHSDPVDDRPWLTGVWDGHRLSSKRLIQLAGTELSSKSKINEAKCKQGSICTGLRSISDQRVGHFTSWTRSRLKKSR